LPERQITTKDVSLLDQLYRDGQLRLAPEFQRNSVWPRPAKAYLIDTILADRPIPLLFLQKSTSPQTGRPVYAVIDGQQRLRAIFEFMDGRFRLTQSVGRPWANKSYEELSRAQQEQLRDYTFAVEELRNYSVTDIEDLFVRINKYVVRLSPQELRHAREEGKFADFVEEIGKWELWREYKVFSPSQLARMRSIEFAAELAILLIEGPQDKKSSIDLYYGQYRDNFPRSTTIAKQLRSYILWIADAIPNLAKSRYRRPVDLYALIGALDRLSGRGRPPSKLNSTAVGKVLEEFERKIRQKRPAGEAARYLVAASRQTDNIAPRETRIEILEHLIAGS